MMMLWNGDNYEEQGLILDNVLVRAQCEIKYKFKYHISKNDNLVNDC